MNYYYFYRMTCDTGNAPCVFNNGYKQTNLLTLACCKGGQIRRYKGTDKNVYTGLRHTIGEAMKKNPENDYYVIGILKDRIIYVAKIREAILMNNYFSDKKYLKRMDCIYKVVDTNEQWKLKRRDGFNPSFHGLCDTNQHHHDELGEYVLLSDDFVYQGRNQDLLIDDNVKELMPKRQETKTYNDAENHLIADFVKRCLDKGIRSGFEPTERLSETSCKGKRCQK